MEQIRVIIFSALTVEHNAIKSLISDPQPVQNNDGKFYTSGYIKFEHVILDLLLVKTGKNNVNSAIEVTKALSFFPPDFIIFLGIAGGIKDVNLGDIVVADKIYGFEFGSSSGKFQSRPEIGIPSYAHIEFANYEIETQSYKTLFDDISSPIEIDPVLHVGPIAAGEKLIKSSNSSPFKEIKNHYNDALCVEMEGYGFMKAAHIGSIEALVIRSISDLIDNKEEIDSTGFQKTACNIVANFGIYFLKQILDKKQVDPKKKEDLFEIQIIVDSHNINTDADKKFIANTLVSLLNVHGSIKAIGKSKKTKYERKKFERNKQI